MAFSFASILEFFFGNILWFIALGLIGWIGYQIYRYLKVGWGSSKVINRSEVERLNFIERMKFNPSTKYKWLYKGFVEIGNFQTGLEKKGVKLLGKITHYLETVTNPKEENKKIKLVSVVVKPMLSKRLNMTNPFAKSQVIQFKNDDETCIRNDNEIYISDEIGLTNYFGIYYSIGKDEKKIIENIRENDIFKTDINSLASIYFVKSQEQSTFDPNYAHQMAIREKELQIELAKRKGKQETL